MGATKTTLTRSAGAPCEAFAGVADEELVAWAVDGDREAFSALVTRHQRALVGYLARLTGNRDGALDLAQDVFIKVYQSLDTFDPSFRFTTWLYRIASNWAIDQHRRRPPRTLPLDPPTTERDASSEPSIAGDDPSPHEILRLRELESRLDAAIAELPARYRQLILLRHRQHCRYDEIARIANLPLGTVKNRIFRAREILRVRLADVLGAEA